MKPRGLLALVLFLAASFLAAGIGGVATAKSVNTWYLTLQKPAWNPPSAVFAPVWTILYAAMAIAAWRVWRLQENPEACRTRKWFAAQLVLNALWSVLFFGLRSPGAALIDIVALWALLVAILFRFAKVDAVATALWAPYVAWVSFATALNATIWWLNR